jgi:hypothetical protein
MADTGGIRAGKAFVEVYADKTKLTRGLKSISADLKAFGAGISSLGRKFMALGAAVTAPMLLATKSWAESGAELARMSNRTGMAVEALSTLKFAAETTGTEFEAVETGIKRMQKAIYSVSQGGEGPAFLAAMLQLHPEDAIAAIADKLAGMTNPTERAAVALKIFGRGGTAMLPMLSRGSAGLAEFRKEAEAMGKIRSKEDAAAALQLATAWNHVKGALTGLKNAVGSALGPMLTGLATKMQQNIKMVRDWIKEHPKLIQQIFMAGATAMAAGVGLFALGKGITFIGMAFAGALAVIKGAVATFGFLQSAVLLLANPFVLVGAAAVALGGYLLYASGAAGKAATWISQTFATLLSEVTSTFGVIAESMAAGDFVSAAKVGWALVSLEWQKGVAFITGLWEGFKGLYDEATMGLAIGMINASAQIQGIWAELINWMAKAWEGFANSGFTESLTRMMAPLIALATGGTIAEAQKAITDQFAGQRAEQGGKVARMDAETAAKKKAIEDERQGKVGLIGGDLARRGAERDARTKAAQDSVDAARTEWDAAKKEAQAKAAAGGAKGTKFVFGGAAAGMDLEAAKGPKSSVRGTFSASAVAGLGVGGIQERIAKAVEAGKAIANKQLAELKRIELEATA